MALPYQCIQACNRSANGTPDWILFGARGSKLVAQSSSGATSVWPAEENYKIVKEPDEPQEPPGKKIKLSHTVDQPSNFSTIVISSNKKYLVAVTAEDKCIRVYQIDSDCHLHQLSQRCMARRPSAIALAPDDSTILSADKFGDVYAVPLLQPPEDGQNRTPGSEQSETTAQKQFVPSASVFTVHSGRNRKVLEEQIKQASKGQLKTKEPLKFKHDLLLGHVSMLTDIAYTTVDTGGEEETPRSYILTADRDEHVRISRGPPQAHIIEGFCHGHEEFVSRLCLTKSGLLVSGGGDAHLLVWDWLNYRLLEKLGIRDAVLGFFKTQAELASMVSGNEDGFKIAVSGIWSVPQHHPENEILVACEGVPALFNFRLGGKQKPSTIGEVIPLSGNALDVTFICPSKETRTAVVSVDNLHKPGSTTETREDLGPYRLQYFSYQDGKWGADPTMDATLEWFSRRGADDSARNDDAKKAIRDILYGVQNLRKQAGAED
ncbi:guanine-N(7)--methyltransferase subunit TRM82 [Zopfia rhizophila CBS 207.26]|uniref:Guanine-N(7)--methyltransferase subunit TRM82 n=1 Tax=Zopfia rhizophila CBS 207.26 TaxID=1314779 RepID=A0A6A6E9K0_9PEZI|nr:guanine-N(7)--methyltransferase subunit TRM82 [Zopfia rhizophila CBS 207.26]